MRKFVFDACSLIYLTKVNIKEKLPLLGKIFIGEIVKKEVISDLDRFPDARKIKSNLEKKNILIDEIKKRNLKFEKNLGLGEKESIEISIKKNRILVSDDLKSINYALSLGIKPKTSEIILLELLNEDIINFDEFMNSFLKLASIKLLDYEVISFFQEKANEIINQKKIRKEVDNL